MGKILHANIADIPKSHKQEHEGYEYYRRNFMPDGCGEQCTVSVYEIPPGKSAYPYHSHVKNEELFYIISGSGMLKTPDGLRPVSAGELIFFPANADGAHKLTNTSESEMLVYLDFDTRNDLDVALYPDSGKVGIWGKDIRRLYKIDQDCDYFDGE